MLQTVPGGKGGLGNRDCWIGGVFCLESEAMKHGVPSCVAALLLCGSAAQADITIHFTNRTFTGFNFVSLEQLGFNLFITGTLTGASINATLNASTAYTYADDLCVYVDVEPLSTGGKLQIGGFSHLGATQRYVWPNGGASPPGTTSIGTVNLTTALVFTGDKAIDGTVWIGNGYGAAGTSGTWTGTITLHGIDACYLSGPCACGTSGAADPDGDGRQSCVDNCPFVPNVNQADCDGDGQGDACESWPDCNSNGRPDNCDVAATGTSPDVNSNGIPDECEPDCNSNGSPDSLDVQNGTSIDCEANGIPDECESRQMAHSTGDLGRLGPTALVSAFQGAVPTAGAVELRVEVIADLGAPTEFARLTIGSGATAVEVASTLFQNNGIDCPASPQVAVVVVPAAIWNAALDASGDTMTVTLLGSPLVDPAQCAQGQCRVTAAYLAARPDCDGDGIADSCELAGGATDCDTNLVPDACDILRGAADVDADGVPDVCQSDCDGDRLPDSWEISMGLSADCDTDGIPDSCEIAGIPSLDCDADGKLDSCELTDGTEDDCDGDGILNRCEIAAGAPDCNLNGRPDACDVAAGGGSSDIDSNGVPDSCQPDCNANGWPDSWEIAQQLVPDCDANGRPDACDIAQGAGDCDRDQVLDRCEIVAGATDKDSDGRPDACEYAAGDFDLDGQINGADVAYLLAVWGLPGQEVGDLDGDGAINGSDLARLLSRWGILTY